MVIRISEKRKSITGKVYEIKKDKAKERQSVQPIPFSKYKQAIYSSKPEVRKELYNQYGTRREKLNKQEAARKLESASETIQIKFGHIRVPSFSGNLSYRSGNPLKKLLSTHKTTVRVG